MRFVQGTPISSWLPVDRGEPQRKVGLLVIHKVCIQYLAITIKKLSY